MTPLAAAGWFGVCAAAAVAAALRANYQHRDDWWDRRLQGATFWGKARWLLFDRDARKVVGGYTTAAVLAAVAVAGPLVAYPTETVAVAGTAAAVVALAVVVGRRLRKLNRTSGYAPVVDPRGREDDAYAFGGFDWFDTNLTKLLAVKFGHSAQDDGAREEQVREQQVRTFRVMRLADGPGGEPREKEFHARLDSHRYPRSEWFRVSPEVLDAVAELERPTKIGRRILKRYLA